MRRVAADQLHRDQDDPHIPNPAEHRMQFGLVAHGAGDQRPAAGKQPQFEPLEAFRPAGIQMTLYGYFVIVHFHPSQLLMSPAEPRLGFSQRISESVLSFYSDTLSAAIFATFFAKAMTVRIGGAPSERGRRVASAT